MAETNGQQPRLQRHYREKVVPALKEQFGFDNIHQIGGIQIAQLHPGAADHQHR